MIKDTTFFQLMLIIIVIVVIVIIIIVIIIVMIIMTIMIIMIIVTFFGGETLPTFRSIVIILLELIASLTESPATLKPDAENDGGFLSSSSSSYCCCAIANPCCRFADNSLRSMFNKA